MDTSAPNYPRSLLPPQLTAAARPLRLLFCAASLYALLPGSSAAAGDPLELIPADVRLCWSSRPASAPDSQPKQGPNLAAWLDLGARLVGRPLQGSALLWMRGFEAFGQIIKYPHSLAVIDAEAKALNDLGSRRVHNLQMALVVDTLGDETVIPRIIQKMINDLSSSATASLVERRAGRWPFQEFRDQRLEDWAVLAWGRIHQYSVVTLGTGVFERTAALADNAQLSLARDPWVAALRRAALERRSADESGNQIEVFLNVVGICERLDPAVNNRATDFFNAWDARDVDRAFWSVGFRNRALDCRAWFRRGGRDIERVFADSSARRPDIDDAIPPTAHRALFRIPARTFIPQLLDSLVATRGELLRDDVRRKWRDIEQDMEFSGQHDVLDRLGDYVILHNDPPHPLGLPFMVTMMFEIKENPAKVRETIDKMCAGWKSALDKAQADSPVPSPLVVNHDDDGVWYLQIGLAGPAWTVTDRFLVASWSPAALREYLQNAGPRAGTPIR